MLTNGLGMHFGASLYLYNCVTKIAKSGTVYYSVKKVWYDNNGNVVKEQVTTNAPGDATSYSEIKYTYDNRNRLIMTETNDGAKSNYT